MVDLRVIYQPQIETVEALDICMCTSVRIHRDHIKAAILNYGKLSRNSFGLNQTVHWVFKFLSSHGHKIQGFGDLNVFAE